MECFQFEVTYKATCIRHASTLGYYKIANKRTSYINSDYHFESIIFRFFTQQNTSILKGFIKSNKQFLPSCIYMCLFYYGLLFVSVYRFRPFLVVSSYRSPVVRRKGCGRWYRPLLMWELISAGYNMVQLLLGRCLMDENTETRYPF